MVQEEFGSVEINEESLETRYDLWGDSFQEDELDIESICPMISFKGHDMQQVESDQNPGIAELAYDVHKAVDEGDYSLSSTPSRFFASEVYDTLQVDMAREGYVEAEDVLDAVDSVETARIDELSGEKSKTV